MLGGDVAQRAAGGAREQVYEVGAQAGHHHLGLGVAHAHVVLNHLGLALAADEPEEYKAAVCEALVEQALDGGAHDALLDLGHESVVGKRHGAYGAHAAGVEAGIALAHTLVVLGHGQYAV